MFPPLKPVKGDLSDLTPIVIGGSQFSDQYEFLEKQEVVTSVLKHAFKSGINALDTSPYYGNSEVFIGQALKELALEFPRENYYISTKVGRLGLDEFNYSPDWIEESVERSLRRLNTLYLDVVFLHDVEFNSDDAVVTGMRTLASLKKKGLIRHFGISGYPLDVLIKQLGVAQSDPAIGPLDIVLSYCNLNLQNTRLLNARPKLEANGVRYVLNALVLAMLLLRSGHVFDFHPALPELRKSVKDAAKILLKEDNVELADLALRFSFREWDGVTVIGFVDNDQIDNAFKQYDHRKEDDKHLIEKFRGLIKDHIDETW